MNEKIFSVAILGTGARGADVYGRIMAKFPEKFNIVSLCDIREERLSVFGEEFGVEEKNRFTDEEEFFKEKRADVIIIATQDADHVRHAIKALELGYDILLEKPITDSKSECKRLLNAQKKSGKNVIVCHVLRYAPAFVKAFELIDKGEIGELVSIDALERVGYWHQAHSFVRGNWRSTKYTAPMILAKCCHDLDLLQYYAKSRCNSISSVGNLAHFAKENAPEGADVRCTSCKHIETCPYSAKKIYIDMWHADGSPEDTWPYNIITQAPLDENKLYRAIENGPYGRCVYRCDNNVCDHMSIIMEFDNAVTATFSLHAQSSDIHRDIHILCENGEIYGDDHKGKIQVTHFIRNQAQTPVTEYYETTEYDTGHGGGDDGIMEDFTAGLSLSGTDSRSSISRSVESHLMACAIEQARITGTVIDMKAFKESLL